MQYTSSMKTCRHCDQIFDEEASSLPSCSKRTDGACEPKLRGFAAMNKDRVKEIAASGGIAAHKAGTAHQFNAAEAIAAGAKGGKAPHKTRGKTPNAKQGATPPTDKE